MKDWASTLRTSSVAVSGKNLNKKNEALIEDNQSNF